MQVDRIDGPDRGPQPRIGTAGWTIPGPEQLPGDAGTHLERYARRLACAEVNTSFYRPHRASTWERWAASTPAHFRFSVKLPRAISHDLRLAGEVEPPLTAFLAEVAGLGDRLGPLLLQLPPSLVFDADVVDAFLTTLRARHAGPVACEPRNASWFEPGADALLAAHRIARVAADPAVVPAAALPGGWNDLVYLRLHGSPVMYRSAYDEAATRAIAVLLAERAGDGAETWCIFDNTAAGAALGDALRVQRLLSLEEATA